MGVARDVLERVIAAAGAKDIGAFFANFDPNVEFSQSGIAQTVGAANLRPFIEGQWTAFPDLRYEWLDHVESETRIAAELRVSATHLGPLGTTDGQQVPPTGRAVQWDTVLFIDIAGDKITQWHSYSDRLVLLSQLGLLG